MPREFVKDICKHCPLLPTKIENLPAHLQYAYSEVGYLEERGNLKNFPLPYPISCRQAAMLMGAKRGRDRSDAKRIKANKEAAEDAAEQQQQRQSAKSNQQR